MIAYQLSRIYATTDAAAAAVSFVVLQRVRTKALPVLQRAAFLAIDSLEHTFTFTSMSTNTFIIHRRVTPTAVSLGAIFSTAVHAGHRSPIAAAALVVGGERALGDSDAILRKHTAASA